MKNNAIDAKDILILEALQEDGRMPISALAREVNLSQPAVSERVKKLEERGIIEGYTARIDPRALGLGMTALIRLNTEHKYIKQCLDTFQSMSNVLEVNRITGEDCFILKVLVPNPESLEPIVDTIAQFGSVKTSIVLRSEPVRPIGKALLELV